MGEVDRMKSLSSRTEKDLQAKIQELKEVMSRKDQELVQAKQETSRFQDNMQQELEKIKKVANATNKQISTTAIPVDEKKHKELQSENEKLKRDNQEYRLTLKAMQFKLQKLGMLRNQLALIKL